MNPGHYSLTIYRGDTYRWRFTLFQDLAQTVPADLTGVTANSQIRDKPGGMICASLACTVSLPNIVDAVLAAGDSANLPSDGAWDLQLTYASGDVATVLAGPVNVIPDVTNTVPVPFVRFKSRRA